MAANQPWVWIDPEVILAYGELTDDMNPIHIDPVYAAGTAKGQSLTYDDGRKLGHQQGYEVGYKRGYQGAYQRAFDSGQAQGYYEGKNSSAAIRDGSAQGQLAGYKAGYADGVAAGDYAGYQAGYADGRVDGYAAGYADGQDACLGSGAISRAAPRAKASLRAASLRPRTLAIGEQPPSPEQMPVPASSAPLRAVVARPR